MAVNYSQRLPQDRNNAVMTDSLPPFPALAPTLRETGAASSVTALNANTTAVQVTAVGGGAAIKWGNNQETSVFASVGGASYDATLPPNSTRLFVVPRFSQGVPSIVGLNVQNGLYSAIATRSLGVGSVLLTEY